MENISLLLNDVNDPADQAQINFLLGDDKEFHNRKKFPRKLFLYKSLASKYTLEQLKDSTLHFSTPDKFNDPFDSIFAKSVLYASIEKIMSELGLPIRNEDVDETYSGVSNIQKIIKVSCLTESNKDIKMWAYYANAHKGLCLEYDPNLYEFTIDDIRHFLFPVIYTDKIQNLLDKIKTIKDDKIFFNFDMKHIYIMALCKLKIWADEKEWRFILRTDKIKNDNIVFPITGIYLGLKISNDDKERVIAIAKAKQIPCYQMEVSNTELGIVPGKQLV